MQHPNIVQVYEVGEHEGKPFFSLEFCGGGSLAQKARRHAVAGRGGGRAGRDAGPRHAGGPRAAHHPPRSEAGQRAADGRRRRRKITDFGLAKKLDEAGQTQSGAVMGTPTYMAPEQAERQDQDIGPPADVYALGAILYECLTGRPPFKAATSLDTIMQVVSDEPVPPSQLQPKTPRDLETICLKCLQKEPAKR